jgi:hypothetical protein
MNTDEIRCILQRALQGGKCRFLGVFPADYVPLSVDAKLRCCCVANTDPHTRDGEHWVAFVYHGRSIEYFDPFGMPLDTYPALYDRMHKQRNAITSLVSLSAPVQPPLSTACGHFCVYFLFHRCRSNLSPASRIVKHLLRLPMSTRDAYVYSFLRRVTYNFSITRPCRDQVCKGSQCCKPRNKWQ